MAREQLNIKTRFLKEKVSQVLQLNLLMAFEKGKFLFSCYKNKKEDL
jgi:hypothetical protein